MYPFCITTH